MRTPKPTASGAWKVRFRLEDGTQTSETFAAKRDADDFCRDLNELGPARARRRLLDSIARRDAPTLDAIFELFIAWKAPRVRSDRTIVDYRRDYRLWIAPRLGGEAATAITATDVQEWVDAMVDGRITGSTDRKASPKSIIDRHALLHQILGFAAAPSRRLIDANPCSDTELPKKRRTPPKGLNPNEWRALAAALERINPDGLDLAEFLLSSGWRWSEGIALNTYDVEDYGERGMWVSMRHVGRRGADNRVEIVEDGKGAGSERRIALDQDMAAVVRRRVAAAEPGGLVFTTATGAQWHYSNFRDRAWDPAVKAANLGRKPTPHWLRHTAVLWGSLGGANIAELSSRIGHRHISTTIDTYGQAITDISPDSLERIASLRAGTRRVGSAAPREGADVLEQRPLVDGDGH